MFEWDETKRQANRRKHGLDFADADRFDLDTALVAVDVVDGEERFSAIGWFDGRLTHLTFADRGDAIRLISWRPATRYERKRFADA